MRSSLATVENARDGFEEASDHLTRQSEFSGLTLGPVREIPSTRLSAGQLGWERWARWSDGRSSPETGAPGTLELRLGGALSRGGTSAGDPTGSVVERLRGPPAMELRATAADARQLPRWREVLRAVRAELESDEPD